MNLCFRFPQGAIQVEFPDLHLDAGGTEYPRDGQGLLGPMPVSSAPGLEGGPSSVSEYARKLYDHFTSSIINCLVWKFYLHKF